MEDKDFAHIVNDTKGVVLSSVKKHLAGRFYHAIDDVVQETYIRAYKGLIKNKFREDSAIETWLYSIARNESRRMNDRLKREEIKFNKSLEEMNEKIAGEQSGEQAHLREKVMHIKELIKDLPEKYSSVMELAAMGFSEKQISRRLNIKRGTVKSRASRGRELIQRLANGGTTL